MRDIRGDLQERASLVEQHINAAQNQFEKLMQQLKSEHDSRAIDLKAALNAVNRVIEIEHRRLGSATSAPKSRPQESLADFLVRKLKEAGPMSSEDLGRLAVQEEYFPNGHGAQEGVYATLMHMVEAGQMQQVANAKFAPTTDATKLRRAV
jgi:hypothetical protein